MLLIQRRGHLIVLIHPFELKALSSFSDFLHAQICGMNENKYSINTLKT